MSLSGSAVIKELENAYERGRRHGEASAREAIAKQVEAMGCICLHETEFRATVTSKPEILLHNQDNLKAEYNWPTNLRDNPSVKVHDPRCPQEIARRIRWRLES